MLDTEEQFNEERKELAELEYSEPVAIDDNEDTLEVDEPKDVCTCEIDVDACLIHGENVI